MFQVVILGNRAYKNDSDGRVGWPIRFKDKKYQALINSRWTNIQVLGFMDYDPFRD